MERSPEGPAAYVELFKQTFGPVVALYSLLATEPDRLAALDAEFHDFARRSNQGEPGGAAAYPYEYLLVVATKGYSASM